MTCRVSLGWLKLFTMDKSRAAKRVEELTSLLNTYNHNYYVLNNSLVSDQEFDLLLKETLNDGLNDGVYNSTETTDSGNLASEDYFTIQIFYHYFVITIKKKQV